MFGKYPVLFALLLTLTSPVWAANVCSRIADEAWKACVNEARDDLFIARGNCRNTDDNQEFKDCKDDAKNEYDEEALPLCDDQLDARSELCEFFGESAYTPFLDPADFLAPEDITPATANPYFPLVAGNTWTYVNEEEGETIVVTVMETTIEIFGIEAVVVNDRVFAEGDEKGDLGELIEDTDDWYGQDKDGNIWYLGEIALNFEDGFLVDIEGSWRAGFEDAQPGIIMPGAAVAKGVGPGTFFRNEFLLGDAEDVSELVSTTGDESVDIVDCESACRVFRDFSPLEPDVEELKYYKAGIGMILETDPKSGIRVELVEFDLAQ